MASVARHLISNCIVMLGPKRFWLRRFRVFPIPSEDTLYPILQRACWPFNIAIQGRRPTTSLELKLTPKQCKLAGTNLGTTFALTECRGDLAWHLLFFPLWSHYWKCGAICWRCNAARIPRPGFQKKTSPSPIKIPCLIRGIYSATNYW